MPIGNAVAALALHRLGLLSGCQAYIQNAEKALQSVADNVNQTPFHAASFVALLEAVHQPPLQIILRGERSLLARWRTQILPGLKPDQMAYFIPDDAQDLLQAIAQRTSDKPISEWLCEGFSCRPPLHDLDALLADLQTGT